jgi:hypothetical protein
MYSLSAGNYKTELSDLLSRQLRVIVQSFLRINKQNFNIKLKATNGESWFELQQLLPSQNLNFLCQLNLFCISNDISPEAVLIKIEPYRLVSLMSGAPRGSDETGVVEPCSIPQGYHAVIGSIGARD